MRKTEEFEIDGTRFSVSHYSTTKANELMVKLGKIIGKPLGMLVGEGRSGKLLDLNIEGDTLGKMFEHVFTSVSPSELPQLQKEILEGVFIYDQTGSREIVYDIDFCGDLGKLFKLLQRVLVFQFGFLQNLAGVRAAPPAKTTAARVKAL